MEFGPVAFWTEHSPVKGSNRAAHRTAAAETLFSCGDVKTRFKTSATDRASVSDVQLSAIVSRPCKMVEVCLS